MRVVPWDLYQGAKPSELWYQRASIVSTLCVVLKEGMSFVGIVTGKVFLWQSKVAFIGGVCLSSSLMKLRGN